MKKSFTFGIMVAMTTLMFVSSCEPDPWGQEPFDMRNRGDSGDYGYGYGDRGGGSSQYDQAVTYYLDGMWRGNTHWYNTWTGHNYTTSEIEFIPQSYRASCGTGYWVDYYDNYQGNYYICNNITWTVDNGVINVHFVQENSNVQIYDYTISEKYFDGYIYDNGKDVEFQLDYITAPHYGSWDDYTLTVYDTSYSKGTKQSSSDDEKSKIIWDRSLK